MSRAEGYQVAPPAKRPTKQIQTHVGAEGPLVVLAGYCFLVYHAESEIRARQSEVTAVYC